MGGRRRPPSNATQYIASRMLFVRLTGSSDVSGVSLSCMCVIGTFFFCLFIYFFISLSGVCVCWLGKVFSVLSDVLVIYFSIS